MCTLASVQTDIKLQLYIQLYEQMCKVCNDTKPLLYVPTTVYNARYCKKIHFCNHSTIPTTTVRNDRNDINVATNHSQTTQPQSRDANVNNLLINIQLQPDLLLVILIFVPLATSRMTTAQGASNRTDPLLSLLHQTFANGDCLSKRPYDCYRRL